MINNKNCIVNVTVVDGSEILPAANQFRLDFLRMISELSNEKEIDFIGVELLSNEQIFDQFKNMVSAEVEKDVIGEFIINEICKAMAEKKPVVNLVTQPEILTKETNMNTAAQTTATTSTDTSNIATEVETTVTPEGVNATMEKAGLTNSKPFINSTLQSAGLAVLGAVLGSGSLWIWNRFVK